MPSSAEFRRSFSIPREPNTSRTPGQFFEFEVPRGRKVALTDIYVENLGGGNAALQILEQRSASSFELRYVYNTKPEQVLSINLSTGLRLGDEAPIRGKVRIQNSSHSTASILVRVIGQLIR